MDHLRMFILCLHLLYLADISNGQTAQAETEEIDFRFSRDCFIENKRIRNGYKFTTQASGPCITYTCQNRAIIPTELKCQYGDKCIPTGTNVTTNQCIKQQCQKIGQSVGFTIVEEGCPSFTNECIKVNSLYQTACVTYKCVKENTYYSLNIIDKGCEYNGQCLKRNETVSEQCKIQRCDERNNMVGIYTVETGCPFFNGKCLKTGEFGVDKCRLYHCQAELVNGEVWFTAKEKAVMCEDVRGECHGAGMNVTVQSKNGQNINCTCVVYGLTVGYQC